MVMFRSDWQYTCLKNIGLSSGASAPEILIDEIKNALNKRYTINETTHNPYGKDDYEKLWEIECERWGGADVIEEHWQRYRKYFCIFPRNIQG